MIYDLTNILGLVVIGYALWRQHERVEDAEMMIGYILTRLDEEVEDDLHDHET
jgi:hypothetical protein